MTFILGMGRYSLDAGWLILLRILPTRTCPVVWAFPKSNQYIGAFSSLFLYSLYFFRNRHRSSRERVLSVQVMMMFASGTLLSPSLVMIG